MNHTKAALITFGLVILFDQWLKIWVKTNMYIGESAADLGILEIFFIENNGMAFGTELGGTWGKLALSVFRMVAIGGIAYYLFTQISKKAAMGLIVSIALIMAGAFGNLIDSMFYGLIFNESPEYFFEGVTPPAQLFPEDGGYAGFLHGKVVDMLHFTVHWPDWMPWVGGDQVFPPVFNIADASITVGVAMMIIWNKRYFPKKEETRIENDNTEA